MGERGQNCLLRFSPGSCGFLRFPAVFCSSLRLQTWLPCRSRTKSAKICESLRQAAVSPFESLPFSAAQLKPSNVTSYTQARKTSPFGGISAASPRLGDAEEVVVIRRKKAWVGPEKAPIRPEWPDFPGRIFARSSLKIWGLSPRSQRIVQGYFKPCRLFLLCKLFFETI